MIAVGFGGRASSASGERCRLDGDVGLDGAASGQRGRVSEQDAKRRPSARVGVSLAAGRPWYIQGRARRKEEPSLPRASWDG
jgi:hypothetical protein